MICFQQKYSHSHALEKSPRFARHHYSQTKKIASHITYSLINHKYFFFVAMESTMLFKSPSTLPPLAFSTPMPSPNLLRLQRRKRAANEPPPLLNRKRTAPSSCSSAPDIDASYLPTFTNLPFLDCENFGNGLQAPSQSSASSLPLPSVTLHPRTKRSRINCFVSSPPQVQDNQDRSEYDSETRRGSNTPSLEENNDDDITINEADADFSKPLRRASSSKSMLSRRPSVTLTRSLSLQVSLINLAAAGDCCPLSASTSSMMPKRKSLLKLKTSSSSLSEMQNQDVNHRRSPVAATLDYLATAIRFPDVGIGLSI